MPRVKRSRSATRFVGSLLSGIMLLSLLAPVRPSMAETSNQNAGRTVDERKLEIGPGATYTWKNIELDRGAEKLHYVEFNPANPAMELQPATTGGKIYGMQELTKMAADADREGNRVIAGINGDYYDMSNGLPLGLFMGGGELLNSPPDDWYAFGMKSDGSTLYGSSPKLTRTVSIGGTDRALTAINRLRGNDSLVLYTSSFHTSTATNDLGDEVVLDIDSGEFKSGQTLKLKVAAIHKDKGNTVLSEGKAVLSASGKPREWLAGLQVGDEASLRLELDPAWKDVTTAIGGSAILIADGQIQESPDPAVHPRTAIGTKADGTVIMLVIDGRQPGFSEGVTLNELAAIMKEMGAVNALNLDGGGSATFVARLPGETARKVLNSPSDGVERKTANGLLLVNKTPEGAADKLVVQPQLERVLAGSKASFKALAVDGNLHPASMPGAVEWSLAPDLGTIGEGGAFTAGDQAGTAEIKAVSGALSGTGTVEVVDQLTELRFGDAVKSFAPGQSETLSVTALRDGQVVRADNSRLEWRVEGEIGTIDAGGTFTAANVTEKTGKIYVSHKGVETSVDVNIGLPPVVLEDFENGLDRYLESAGAQYNSVKASIEQNEDLVRFGNGSLKLEYDFTGKPGTSGAYLQTKSQADNIAIPGYPEKISMWVYGDGKKHWLRAKMRDAKGAVDIDFVPQDVGVDFEGWKYLEAVVPKGRTLPLTMDVPVRYMETKADKKDAGVLYVDQIRAMYGPNTDDMDPPVVKDLMPAEGAVVKTNQPKISVIAEDKGYDPDQHPGTTLIDPEKIRFYLDGKLVEHTLYPPKGQIHYTPGTPLADGVHQAKVSVRDLSGNQTIKEWTFQVDTGASKLVYDTPETVYAGGTYTLDLSGVKTSNIRSGTIAFAYDPAKIGNLQLIRNDKVSESRLRAEIDPAGGKVTISFNDLDAAGLSDQDLIGQLQYDVKKDAAGTHAFAFLSGSISFADTGAVVYPIFGLPLTSKIANHLTLSWNESGQVEGYETVLQVKDERGTPVSGAQVTADGKAIGTTDDQGQLRTKELTAVVKTYKLQAEKGSFYSPVMAFAVSKLAGTKTPYNINVNMGEDPTVSRGFAWHTHPDVEQTVVEIAKQSGFTDFDGPDVKTISGDSYLYHTLDLGTIRVHKALASDLEPGTAYVYRVGDEKGNYGPKGTFRTTDDSSDRTKFLYFADSQASKEAEFKLWGNTVRKAVNEHPDAEFIVQAGDMVDKGFNEQEWNYWFKEAQDAFLNTTLVGAIGNHEVMGTKGNSDFLAHFNQPGNGLPSLKGSSFSFDYKNAHIVVLNSEYEYEAQKEWLKQDLAKTKKKWKIAIFHRGPYGSVYDTAEIRDLWAPVLEENGVDLVLNGHDHIYLRTHPMKGKEIAKDGQGTTYVIAGSSGPKFYPLTKRDWQYITDEEQTQMYASIEMTGDELKMVTKTVGGRIVDEFTLSKTTVPPERVEIKEQNVNLAVGESKALTAVVKPDNTSDKTVTWSVYGSKAEEVVTVSAQGVVTAKGLGKAVVRAASKAAPHIYADTTITVDRIPGGAMESLALQGKTLLKTGETDQTVTEAVYGDGTRIRLLEGVVYLSSNPGVAAVDDGGLVRALSPGATVISATYGEFRARYDLTVQRTGSPGDGGGNPGNGGGEPGNGGGGSSTGPVPPPVKPPVQPDPKPTDSGQITVTASELAAMKSKGKVVITSAGSLKELLLPGHAGALLGDIPITVEAPNAAVTIPAEVLRALSALVASDQRESAVIKLTVNQVTGQDALRPLALAGKSGAEIVTASDLLAFSLGITPKDGKEKRLDSFTKPVSITLPVRADADRKLTGMYFIANDGGLEYIGGTWKDGKLTANVRHFSMYAALEYIKTYSDVPERHWAYRVIREMSAQHLLQGVSDEKFAPDQKVTRAEFTVMLVRSLGLAEEGTSSFRDVADDRWYAGAVSAAAKTGIVKGFSGQAFKPDALIQRQEMAAMIVRAYQYAAAQPTLDLSTLPFSDVDGLPQWALEAVRAAYDLHLMEGSSSSFFKPKATATRAESAQVIYNLLGRLPGKMK
ncbi:phosphodiester glycosidase family protein [Paenibacillus sp. DMB20]|uniref:phosphodiester glycosidase family protein n=1 Tax=Paenibacillus sp. DMB20 TaxID=1642570 RepID=UPI000627ED9F|nr:phosphodiester glycosidase family protein [Paenibacillus sp. DMB20]KKO54132.1 metallophosphoesterase [Paenibacillus sp. DMB20]